MPSEENACGKCGRSKPRGCGRPLKFQSAGELQSEIFASCGELLKAADGTVIGLKVTKRVPTVSGLALQLKTTRDLLLCYEAKRSAGSCSCRAAGSSSGRSPGSGGSGGWRVTTNDSAKRSKAGTGSRLSPCCLAKRPSKVNNRL